MDFETVITEKVKSIESRVDTLEDRMAKQDTMTAIINTKLSAIIWLLGVFGTATIGVLVKMIIGA